MCYAYQAEVKQQVQISAQPSKRRTELTASASLIVQSMLLCRVSRPQKQTSDFIDGRLIVRLADGGSAIAGSDIRSAAMSTLCRLRAEHGLTSDIATGSIRELVEAGRDHTRDIHHADNERCRVRNDSARDSPSIETSRCGRLHSAREVCSGGRSIVD